MAISSGVYAKAIGAMASADLDWDNAGTTVKAMLVKDTYTPNFDTEDFLDDVAAAKVTGTTYQTIGSKAITYDAANNRVHLDGPASVVFSAVAAGENAQGVIIFVDTGVEGTSKLICCNAAAASIPTNGSDITVTFAADGHVRFTY